MANAEKHALRVAKPVIMAQRILRPILYVFEAASSVVNRVTGGESGFESYLSREEIQTIVLSGEETGVLASEEGAMIRSVLELEATTVRSMMVPRTAMIAVQAGTSLESVIETCWQQGVSRVPVYGQTRDDVRGIADLRDVLRARAEGLELADVTTEPRFVPGTMPVDEILTEMQSEGYRMVIVVDEFGTVTGLATLEDVVEEVVGEIFGHGETDPIRLVDADTAVVHGWATVDYVNEMLALDLQTEGPFETVGGLVNYHTGRLAAEGERVELGDVTITVLDATERRVRRVRIDWMDESAAGTQPPDRAESAGEQSGSSDSGATGEQSGSSDSAVMEEGSGPEQAPPASDDPPTADRDTDAGEDPDLRE